MILPAAFLDADTLFAGAASPHEYGASHVLLRMSEFTLLDCVTSEQAVTGAERNLLRKAPDKLTLFRSLVGRCLRVVPDPTREQMTVYEGQADPKYVSILAVAVIHRCPRLITFNTRHYWPPPSLILV